jgi:hypothetical protein
VRFNITSNQNKKEGAIIFLIIVKYSPPEIKCGADGFTKTHKNM